MTLTDPQYKTLLDAQAVAKQLVRDAELQVEASDASRAIYDLVEACISRDKRKELAAPF